MKYCANCNKEYPQGAEKCSICSLPLLELSSSVHNIINHEDDILPVEEKPAAVPAAEKPAQTEKPFSPPPKQEQKNSGASRFISKLFSVSGAAFGAALLVLVAIVLIFSVFSQSLFGKGGEDTLEQPSAPPREDSTAAPPPSDDETPPPAEDNTPPQDIDDLVISEADKEKYALLCSDEAWVSEETESALTFYEGNTYLRSSTGGQEILQGKSAVSNMLLYMSNRYGELIAYEFRIEDGFLYIIDSDANTVAYESSKTYSPDDSEINDLFDYPVSPDDSTSYEELVALGPWTDAETGYVLIFDSNNSYLTEYGTASGGGYGSALVSEGQLCMVKGNMTSEVYQCTYSLSAGILTISYAGDSYTLHSKSAYEALQLKKQLDEELYSKLVEGSFWGSRDDMGSYHLYFHADHTFELCRMDFTLGKEEFIREGTAVISGDKLTFEFGSTKAEYTLSLQENLLTLTNLNAGDVTTYESFRTFHY